MYKVLIVDDEKLIREGLARHINWSSMGYEVIGTAENASRALEIATTQTPHILITDIRMPGQDGFELIQDLLELGLRPQTILISSYDDFMYAQKAIRFEIIRDYVLKPIDLDQLTEVLKGIAGELEKEKTEQNQNLADIEDYKSFLHDLRLNHYDRNKLVNLIKTGDSLQAMDFWNTVCLTIQGTSYSLQTTKRFCSSLILAIMSAQIYQEADISGTGLSQDPVKTIQDQIHSQEELLSFMGELIQNLCASALHKRGNTKSRLIASCLEIIDREYCHCDFNLTSVAAQLNVTPNYLSVKFKEEVGVGFMKYLVEKQMECAKEMLRDVRYRIYEISTAVGYEDEKYFTRTFKKYEGITPKEYREHVL